MDNYYFKNEQEIRQFFKHHTFKFNFKSEELLFYDTLYPINLGGNLYDFSISFYINDNDFFCYSSLEGENGWLDKFKICEVVSSDSVNNTEKLYFNTY